MAIVSVGLNLNKLNKRCSSQTELGCTSHHTGHVSLPSLLRVTAVVLSAKRKFSQRLYQCWDLFKLIDNLLKSRTTRFRHGVGFLHRFSPSHREQNRVSVFLKWLAKHATSRGTYAAIASRARQRGVSAKTLGSLACVCNHYFRSRIAAEYHDSYLAILWVHGATTKNIAFSLNERSGRMARDRCFA